MTRRDVILLGVAGVVVIGAGAVYWGRSHEREERTEDFPEGHAYICLDCGHVTTMTHGELIAFKAEARESTERDARKIPCADCGSRNTAMALRCPACGKYFERPAGRPICPHCDKPLPSPFGD